jgi:hypothetical protein
MIEPEAMRDDERRLRALGVDEVAQMSVVPLHGTLAAAQRLALEPEHAEVDRDFAVLGKFVGAAGIFGDVGMLLALRIVRPPTWLRVLGPGGKERRLQLRPGFKFPIWGPR